MQCAGLADDAMEVCNYLHMRGGTCSFFFFCVKSVWEGGDETRTNPEREGITCSMRSDCVHSLGHGSRVLVLDGLKLARGRTCKQCDISRARASIAHLRHGQRFSERAISSGKRFILLFIIIMQA